MFNIKLLPSGSTYTTLETTLLSSSDRSVALEDKKNCVENYT
jgi:hypothetical protein